MIINFLYRFFLAVSIVFLLLSAYLNISKMVSGDSIGLSQDFQTLPGEEHTEIYDEKIAKIDNLNDLKKFVDYEIKENNFEGIDIPIYIDEIVRKKYFFTMAFISADTNWILIGVDYFFPERYFLQAMDPEDLVKKNHGMCSQQSIIFQELIKSYPFEYASIRFSSDVFGHFASAVKVDDDWFYFDSFFEPVYDRNNPLIVKKILKADIEVIKKLYPHHVTSFGDPLYPERNLDLLTKEEITLGDLNIFPAKQGVMFQKITQFLSNFSWLVFLIFSFLLRSAIQKKAGNASLS
jgi:hypothetical protein